MIDTARVSLLQDRVVRLTARVEKAWTDEARQAALAVRREKMPAAQVSTGPVGDKRYRYQLSNGHVVDIMDRPQGYRGGGGRFMIRHTGPGGTHFGTAFADQMPGAKFHAKQFFAHAAAVG